jgi:peptidoglycan/LPS O-acetylase OafA/YrhL
MAEIASPAVPSTSKSQASKYRPEIDGLRAFAVVAVIINHFNKDLLPSGYLGVDIFFVISGYVITSSLAGRESKNFLDFLTGFYERRIKRLVPALVVFVLITSVLISLFNPDPGVALGLGWRSLFGISNISLYQSSTDYFAQSTELNPFTHTWSLGVEEQFYLLFPFLIWFSGFGQQKAQGARNLFIWVGALTIASLIGFIFLYQVKQPAAYFLMPLRFWEMASGCLIFIGFQKRARIEQALEQVPPLLVVAAVISVMFLPVSAAVPATIGTVLLSAILIACLKQGTIAYKFFTLEKVVYVGLISYSLYLWHWSVLSISRWTIGIHWWSVPIQCGLMMLIALGSYKWIEAPLRKISWFGIRRNTLLVGLATIATASGTPLVLSKLPKNCLYAGRDYGETIQKPIQFVGDYTHRIAKKCHSSNSKEYDALGGSNHITSNFLNNCLSGLSAKPLVAFSGDSHSLSMFPMSELIAGTGKYDVFSHSRDGCVFPSQGQTSRINCQEVQASVGKIIAKEISRRKPGSIVVATSYLNSHFGYEGDHRRQFKKHSDGSRTSVDENLKDYIAAIKGLARELGKYNALLVVVAPLPQHPQFNAEICTTQWFRPIVPPGCNETSAGYLQSQRSSILKRLLLAQSEEPNLRIYDAFGVLCDRSNCKARIGTQYLYSDDDHLSKQGIRFVANDFLNFLGIKRSKNRTETRAAPGTPETGV